MQTITTTPVATAVPVFSRRLLRTAAVTALLAVTGAAQASAHGDPPGLKRAPGASRLTAPVRTSEIVRAPDAVRPPEVARPTDAVPPQLLRLWRDPDAAAR
jgi:hypothetical protein